MITESDDSNGLDALIHNGGDGNYFQKRQRSKFE